MPNDASPRNERPVSSPIQPCPVNHWFDVRLVMAPDAAPRPRWWPVERRPGYGNEQVSLTGGGIPPPVRTTDGQGRVRVTGIAGGSVQVIFYNFVAELRQAFATGTRYQPR